MKKYLCGIYCIKNTIDNRQYIGLSRDIRRRWNEHRSELRSNQHDNIYLQRAWNKYGEESFSFDIVELCDPFIICDRERHYIAEYHTLAHENGYNLTSGGENSSTTSKKVIHLLTGKIYDSVRAAANDNNVVDVTMIDWCRKYYNFMYLDEYNNMDQEQINYYTNFDWSTFIHNKLSKAHSRENLSAETLLKYSQCTSGKNNPRATAIYSPELGETFWGAKEVKEKYGINQGSISSCINGKLKHAGKHPITGQPLTWQKIEK
jgi:group I intron endonuclease